MIKLLEKLLYEKTEGTQSEILYAQWNYDKKIVPVALNAISSLFPHYSLHDESHSVTIINNIVRILGKEKLELLSAIDIWLILEASYCHDIGMVVSSEKLIEALQSKKFLEFFNEIQKNRKDGLNEFASQFIICDGKINYNSTELNLAFHDGIKFILAEFFRRTHSDRSKEIIANPHEELKLSSPRGVIPQRIFKILGDICSSHTKDFDEVMKLSFSEVGIDTENSHPRFVSCLLRIGDLLDLDNNRFSEVMLRTISKIPIDTLNHKSKHLSIESFRVDSEIIDIMAKCDDYDTANLTQHWFNYLNSEISQQLNNWNKIVPDKNFGYLPTIGSLNVELSNYDYIDGKKKPKFTVDTDKALELLQGAGIYEGAYQFIREILQNSVDATLFRIWLEYNEEMNFKNPNSEDFNKIKNSFPIVIRINEKDIVGINKKWGFEIEDKGIGISTYDLSFLVNTGSSSKNIKKNSLVDEIPKWLRPSGIFGIGFQSIFMLTNQVKLKTKSFFTEQFQIVELNSPNSQKDGGILIKKEKTNHKKKPGTIISFDLLTKAIPERWSIKGDQKNASRIARNYDPFSNESHDVEIGKIIDEIFEFSYKCYIPIKLFLNDNQIDLKINSVNKFNFFDEENSLELNVNFGESHNGIVTYYKNQFVENNLNFLFLSFEFNIHKDVATEVLTLNRNKIRPEYYSKLTQQIFLSTFRIILNHFDEIFKSDDSKCIGSIFLNYYSEVYSYLKGFDLKNYNQWEFYNFNFVDQKKHSIKELLGLVKKVTIIINQNGSSDNFDLFKLSNDQLTITISRGYPSDYTLFLIHKFNDFLPYVKFVKIQDDRSKQIILSNDVSHSLIESTDFITILKATLKNYYSARCIIPCMNKYIKLRLKDEAHEGYLSTYTFDSHVNIKYPKMLSPFISVEKMSSNARMRVELNDKLYNWVYLNRFDTNTTLKEIRENYKKFIEEFNVEILNS